MFIALDFNNFNKERTSRIMSVCNEYECSMNDDTSFFFFFSIQGGFLKREEKMDQVND